MTRIIKEVKSSSYQSKKLKKHVVFTITCRAYQLRDKLSAYKGIKLIDYTNTNTL